MLIPALATKQSKPPKRRTVSATSRAQSAGLVTSPTTVKARPPAAAQRSAASANRSPSGEKSATFAPARAQVKASAAPNPEEAPVMAKVCP
jgi:hypothetical protein